MALNRHSILVLLALVLVGCEREQMDDCFTSSGPERTEVREVGGFRVVDLDDRIDLVLDDLPAGTVVVEAGRNLLEQVRTERDGDVLRVRNGNTCNWVRSFKPRITVRVPIGEVDELMLRGTGRVTATDTVRHQTFRIEQRSGHGATELVLDVQQCFVGLHSGAGDVVLRGRASANCNLYSATLGAIDASGMRARFVNITSAGVADIRCWVDVFLDVRIQGVGDVYYRGDPFGVQSEITGSGQLIRLDP
jgi:hypothetical protein